MPRCAWCAVPMGKPPRGPFPTTCSVTCRILRHNDARPDLRGARLERRYARQRKAVAMVACRFCGADYEVPGEAKRATCGALTCHRAFVAESTRPYLHERRAKIRGSRTERFTEREIFDRDGWICGICDEPVDPAARFPDPRTASLDHEVPVSLGGPHTRANVRCSHLGCNLRRGNRVEVAA